MNVINGEHLESARLKMERALHSARRRQLDAVERQLFWFAVGSGAVWLVIAVAVISLLWN
jgi:hypothetical protein